MDKLVNSTTLVTRRDFFNTSTPPLAAKPTMNVTEKIANGHVNGETHRSISPIVNAHQTSTPINNLVSSNGLVASAAATTVKDSKGHQQGHHHQQQHHAAASSVTINELHGYVGFANIPNQVFRKAIKRGFEFSLMVVGQSGLGKSTFVNTLFLTDICTPGKNARLSTTTKTTRIEETTVKLVEKGVTLTLTLIDTPGFGDAVDNSNCWDTIIQYTDRKNMEFFNEETKVNRKETIADHRVHCCLYFIAPTGHGLKPLDIEFMKRLHDRVNIIPIIAKADTLTTEEMSLFKQKINKEIEENKIRIYDFPDCEDDSSETKEQKRLKRRVPFAIVGSNYIMESGGKQIRCRKYPWGTVEVENLEHNDFVALRNSIIRTHMIDLVEVTRCVHYENFRCNQLTIGDNVDSTTYKHPFTMMDDQRREHDLSLKAKSEDMERVLEEKVNAKIAQLHKTKEELDAKQRNFERLLDEERRKVASLKESLDQDRQVFKQQYPEFHKYESSESLKKEKKKKSVFA